MNIYRLTRSIAALAASATLLLPTSGFANPPAVAAAPPPAITVPTTGAVPPEAPPATAADATTHALPGEAEVVCRTVRSTGSRLRKERVCTSRGATKNAQDWLKRQQTQGTSSSDADVNGGG